MGSPTEVLIGKCQSLNAYFKFLEKTGHIVSSPLVKHKALKVEKKMEVPFSEMEMGKVLQQIPFTTDFEGLRDKLMIETALRHRDS